jgi:hypothetical protein
MVEDEFVTVRKSNLLDLLRQVEDFKKAFARGIQELLN